MKAASVELLRAGPIAARTKVDTSDPWNADPVPLVLVLLVATAGGLTSQEVPEEHLPDGSVRGSQPAEVRQRMGGTEIVVRHNRPSARGRELSGGVVPYDSIWNPGADEASRIEMSTDVLVEGRRLEAGKYSIWAVPGREQWTLILSHAHDVFRALSGGAGRAPGSGPPGARASRGEPIVPFPGGDPGLGATRAAVGTAVVPLRIRPGS